jgi:hypothetical protein
MQKEIDTPRLKLILGDESSLAHGSKYVESAHAVLGSPGATQWKYGHPLEFVPDYKSQSFENLY